MAKQLPLSAQAIAERRSTVFAIRTAAANAAASNPVLSPRFAAPRAPLRFDGTAVALAATGLTGDRLPTIRLRIIDVDLDRCCSLPSLMTSPVPAQPPERAVSADDLRDLRDWLPPTAVTLVEVVGPAAALVLMRDLPGAQFVVPVRQSANLLGASRWAELAAVVGEEVMPSLCEHWGGQALDVPICRELLQEKRCRWIRDRFDYLVGAREPRLSAYTAARTINIALAKAQWPMTLREVQKVINAAPKPAPSLRKPTDRRHPLSIRLAKLKGIRLDRSHS